MHHRERYRPSSTGNLIQRVMPAARVHLWRRERQLSAEEILPPGRELWVLHPNGQAAPEGATAESVEIVLLDGSWSEASTMAKEVQGWGRLVGLPMAGESRYWLRAQQEGARFSTVEALLFALQTFGLAEAASVLREQFELHVYAGLRARGQKELAASFLATSLLADAMPDFIAQLNIRRPR